MHLFEFSHYIPKIVHLLKTSVCLLSQSKLLIRHNKSVTIPFIVNFDLCSSIRLKFTENQKEKIRSLSKLQIFIPEKQKIMYKLKPIFAVLPLSFLQKNAQYQEQYNADSYLYKFEVEKSLRHSVG